MSRLLLDDDPDYLLLDDDPTTDYLLLDDDGEAENGMIVYYAKRHRKKPSG